MKVSAGDTYARKFEHLVAYGPATQAHMPNEEMDIETLMMGCAIGAETLCYLLDCVKDQKKPSFENGGLTIF